MSWQNDPTKHAIKTLSRLSSFLSLNAKLTSFIICLLFELKTTNSQLIIKSLRVLYLPDLFHLKLP